MRWTIASTTKTCFVKLECFHRAFFVWYLLVEMLGVVLPINSVRLTHLRGAIQGIKKTGSPETRPLWAGSSKGLSMTGRSFASDFFLTLLIDWLVVDQPLWKIWVSWDHYSQLNGKIIQMFQSPPSSWGIKTMSGLLSGPWLQSMLGFLSLSHWKIGQTWGSTPFFGQTRCTQYLYKHIYCWLYPNISIIFTIIVIMLYDAFTSLISLSKWLVQV